MPRLLPLSSISVAAAARVLHERTANRAIERVLLKRDAIDIAARLCGVGLYPQMFQFHKNSVILIPPRNKPSACRARGQSAQSGQSASGQSGTVSTEPELELGGVRIHL